MKTDILHTLQAVLLENTTSYQSDFEFDVTTLLEAANKPKKEDRTFYWLSRPCGTWCLKEKEVFLKGSGAYNIWTHYDAEHESFRAFCVVVEEKDGNRLMGEAIPFDYGESVPRIKRAALPYMFISGEYGDGTTFPKMTYAEYESSEHILVKLKHGGLKSYQLYPADEDVDELKLRIAQEHTMQTRKAGPKKGKGFLNVERRSASRRRRLLKKQM